MSTIFEEGFYVDVYRLTTAEKLAIALQAIEDGCKEPARNLIDFVNSANYIGYGDGMCNLPLKKKLPTAVVQYLIQDLYTNEVKKMIEDRADSIVQNIPIEQRDYAKIAYIMKTYREGTEEYQDALHQMEELEKTL